VLRATLSDEVRDLDAGQSRRESLVPDSQERSRFFVVSHLPGAARSRPLRHGQGRAGPPEW